MSEEVDHRQIKEDHIEIYGSDEAGDPEGGGSAGGGGGGGEGAPDGSDYEISQEMYQDEDMHDDGSQVSARVDMRLRREEG